MKRLFAIATIFAAALVSTAPAHAAVPDVVPFAGRLVKDATPFTGTKTVTFRLYDAQSNGTKLWEEVQPDLDIEDGLVYAELGSVTPFPAGALDGNIFLEVEVSDGAVGYTFSPRLPVASVPFAIHAGVADSLDGLAPDDLQKKITGTCPSGSISAVNDDGTVSCHADPTPPSYTGTGAINVSGTTITLSSNGCATGEMWKWSGSAWQCQPDDNTTYTAGAGLQVSGSTIALSSNGCAAGDIWKWSGAAWQCDPDVDTNTTYTGANPVAINGTSIGLSNSGCAAGDVWKWSGSAWSCDPDVDTTTTYTGSGPISVNGTTIGLSSSGCSSGYVLKWNGSSWACSAESVTSYTGTAPIAVNGTSIALSTAGCAAGDVYHWTGSAWSCTPDVDTNTAYAGGAGISVSGNSIALSTSGCQAGYVWKWSGSAWQCAADSDTNTTYTGSAPIAVNGTTVSMTQCPAGQLYKENGSGTGFACAVDNDTTYASGTGVTVSGGTVGLSNSGCQAGYVWKYNGSAFACVPDGNSGEGSFYQAGAMRPNSSNTVAHVTLTTPSSGYLMATLSYGLAVKNLGVGCNVPLKLSTTSGDLAAGMGFQQYFWPNSFNTMDSGTGYGTFVSTTSATFQANGAGAHTVYFNSGQIGSPNCADFLWTNVTLNVVFVPNQLGSGGAG